MSEHVAPLTCTTIILSEGGAPCGEPARFVGNTTDGGSMHLCPNGHKTYRYLTDDDDGEAEILAPAASCACGEPGYPHRTHAADRCTADDLYQTAFVRPGSTLADHAAIAVEKILPARDLMLDYDGPLKDKFGTWAR